MKNLITKEQLEAYDTKKGTAVVEITELPATPENRSYRILGDKTQVFVKDTEMATKEYSDSITVDGNEQDENQNIISKAVLDVDILPATILDKVYNLPNERVFSKDIELSTKKYTDSITVDGNEQDENQDIISKAVLDVETLPSTIGDKVYREETATTNTTTFTFRYGLTKEEIEALGFVYDTEASIANVQYYKWPETADKTEISFQINNKGTVYTLTANTLDYNTTNGSYRVLVPVEQGGPQYYITSMQIGKEYNFTVKETNYGETKVYAKDTELATKDYADDKFIPLIEKAAANGVATLDANGHVPVDQMPTQALIYKGSWDASTGTFPTQDTYTLGDFYIVSTEGTINEVVYRVGDWIIWDGTQWTISRNTNAVASVNGMTGAVVLDGSNIQATYNAETGTLNSCFRRIIGQIDDLVVNIHQNYSSIQNNAYQILLLQGKDTDLQNQIDSLNGDTIEATYEGETDTLNTILTKVGKVKTVDGVSPDDNGNIQSVAVEEVNALPATPEDKVYVVDDGKGGYNIYAKDKLIKNGEYVPLVDEMPESGVVCWNGAEETYIKGHLYKYNGTDWEDITDHTGFRKIFIGTEAEWDSLTEEEKKFYDLADLTDGTSNPDVVTDAITEGDMNPVTSNAVYKAMEPEYVELTIPEFSSNTWRYETLSAYYHKIGRIVRVEHRVKATCILTYPETNFTDLLYEHSMDEIPDIAENNSSWQSIPATGFVSGTIYPNEACLNIQELDGWAYGKCFSMRLRMVETNGNVIPAGTEVVYTCSATYIAKEE